MANLKTNPKKSEVLPARLDGESLEDSTANFFGVYRKILFIILGGSIFYVIYTKWEGSAQIFGEDRILKFIVEGTVSIFLGFVITTELVVKFLITFIVASFFSLTSVFIILLALEEFNFKLSENESALLMVVVLLMAFGVSWFNVSKILKKSSILGLRCKICHKRGGLAKHKAGREFVRQVMKQETYYTEETEYEAGLKSIKRVPHKTITPYNVYDVTMEEHCSHCGSQATWMYQTEEVV